MVLANAASCQWLNRTKDFQVSLSPSLLGEGVHASRWAPELHMIIQIPPHLLPKPDPGPYAPGRVCVHKDCITRLNRNNPGPYCQLHWMDHLPPEERDDAA